MVCSIRCVNGCLNTPQKMPICINNTHRNCTGNYNNCPFQNQRAPLYETDNYGKALILLSSKTKEQPSILILNIKDNIDNTNSSNCELCD